MCNFDLGSFQAPALSKFSFFFTDGIGQIKVWNFHLGLCLQSCQIHFRILSLSFVDFHIYAAGESRAVVDCYDNGAVDVDPFTWEKRHKKSIVSVDFYKNILLASASCEGEIFIWLQKSFEAKVRLRDSKGTIFGTLVN